MYKKTATQIRFGTDSQDKISRSSIVKLLNNM